MKVEEEGLHLFSIFGAKSSKNGALCPSLFFFSSLLSKSAPLLCLQKLAPAEDLPFIFSLYSLLQAVQNSTQALSFCVFIFLL